MGNIITAAFWKVRADRKEDPAFIHNTVKNVMLADFIFTLPGLILIIVSGSLMAFQAGYSMSGFNWLTLSLILFSLTAILWLTVLLPAQRSMIRHSAQSRPATFLKRTGKHRFIGPFSESLLLYYLSLFCIL